MNVTQNSPQPLPAPLAPDVPLPHRKIIRSWLIPLSERTTLWAFVLLAFDYAVLGAFLLGGPLHAAETAAPRSPAWAQAVDPSINLYRMSPTLYRSALPNAQSVALLQRLQVKTVVSFIKHDDRAWLGQAPARVVSLPTHADRVD